MPFAHFRFSPHLRNTQASRKRPHSRCADSEIKRDLSNVLSAVNNVSLQSPGLQLRLAALRGSSLYEPSVSAPLTQLANRPNSQASSNSHHISHAAAAERSRHAEAPWEAWRTTLTSDPSAKHEVFRFLKVKI